jgi:alanine racemase
VYTTGGIEALAAASASAGRTTRVHVKVDTGMRRVGTEAENAVALARLVTEQPSLSLHAVCTHCAVADDPTDPFTDLQLDRFDEVLAALEADGLHPPLVHAANSAAAIAHPRSRYDLVRCGIAIYGIAPSAAVAGEVDLQPAMRLVSAVSFVKRVPAETGVSYGLEYRTGAETTLATVPIGYADGVPRRLSSTGGEVLIGGRRRCIAGVVTMDQIVVDCGDDPVAAGDEVVLLGRQGDEVVLADEWASRLGTIPYEIVCGIGPRVPRRYLP